jgi:hypothetical protein
MSYRRSFNLTLPPGEVWETIHHADRFQHWWGWLTELTVEGPPLQRGTVLSGVISPRLAYRMGVRVVLETCMEAPLIVAAVHGELEGFASLRLTPEGSGTCACVSWSFEMMQPAMRVAASARSSTWPSQVAPTGQPSMYPSTRNPDRSLPDRGSTILMAYLALLSGAQCRHAPGPAGCH